ncbi:hypothetical protein [Halomonas sp. AOP35-4E-18]|uniref:hypothetical protein n=1 Tax=Halomonas sp. AOP35-4E-18 TaxID=3457686 RepID=UPI0037C3070D
MWFIQPKQDYIPEIPWKHTDEPAIMAWQIRARNYNTFVTNTILFVLTLINIGAAYAMSLLAETLFFSFLVGGGAFLFFMLISMSVTHDTTILVYRFTETLAEEYSWKPQAAAAASFLKWSAIILLPIVGVLILMDPSLVIAGIGPLGMGLMAWMMGTQQAKQSNSRHEEWTWEKTEHIKVWRKRSIIALTYQWKPFSKNSYYRPRTHFIFCRADELDERIQLFKEHLPDAEYEEGKVNVL